MIAWATIAVCEVVNAAAMRWILAHNEATSDFVTIEDEEPIEHGRSLLWRIGFALAVLCVIKWVSGLPWIGVAAMSPTSYGIFSYYFRSRLNKLRGLPEFYVSPSNNYDRLMIWLAKDKNKAGRVASRIEWAVAGIGFALPFLFHYLNNH